MYKLFFPVACLACASDGRRVITALDQDFSSQDVQGQRLMKRLHSSASSRSHGQGNVSGSEEVVKKRGNLRKVVPILLAFLGPAAVFAPSSNGMAFNSSIYNNAEKTTSSNSIGVNAGPRVVMMNQNHVEEALPEYWGPTVRVVISVDWEGLHLLKENLRFFKDFREAHPEVPLTHFLSAAYFTKPETKSLEWSPHQALGPIDDCGLLINGLKSLVESSGVQFRSDSNLLQSPEQLEKSLIENEDLRDYIEIASPDTEWAQSENYLSRDVGYDTDIRAYNVNELQAIISKSKLILEKKGLRVGKSFRVGAWLAGPNVLEAFRREGFRVNSSAVSFDEMIGKQASGEREFWRDAPLSSMLRELWHGITKESQPFLSETAVGWLLEMPEAVSVEYTTVEDIVDHTNSAVQQLDSEDRFVHIGFGQETAAVYGAKVIEAITEIKRKHGPRVVFETLKSSARRAMSTQRLKEMAAKIKPHFMQNP